MHLSALRLYTYFTCYSILFDNYLALEADLAPASVIARLLYILPHGGTIFVRRRCFGAFTHLGLWKAILCSLISMSMFYHCTVIV